LEIAESVGTLVLAEHIFLYSHSSSHLVENKYTTLEDADHGMKHEDTLNYSAYMPLRWDLSCKLKKTRIVSTF